MIDLQAMSDDELKALGYDNVLALEVARQNLALIQGELAARAQTPPEPGAPAPKGQARSSKPG